MSIHLTFYEENRVVFKVQKKNYKKFINERKFLFILQIYLLYHFLIKRLKIISFFLTRSSTYLIVTIVAYIYIYIYTPICF